MAGGGRGRYGRMAALGEWLGGRDQPSGELGAGPGLAGKADRGLVTGLLAARPRASMR